MWTLSREAWDDALPEDILRLLMRAATSGVSIADMPGVQRAYLDIAWFGSGVVDMGVELSREAIALLHATGLELQVTLGAVPE